MTLSLKHLFVLTNLFLKILTCLGQSSHANDEVYMYNIYVKCCKATSKTYDQCYIKVQWLAISVTEGYICFVQNGQKFSHLLPGTVLLVTEALLGLEATLRNSIEI